MAQVRWQYRIVDLATIFTADRLVAVLARLGGEGWELVHLYDTSPNWWMGKEKGFALFKRPVDVTEPEPAEGWASIDGSGDAGEFRSSAVEKALGLDAAIDITDDNADSTT